MELVILYLPSEWRILGGSPYFNLKHAPVTGGTRIVFFFKSKNL